jgi:hypothetical protein
MLTFVIGHSYHFQSSPLPSLCNGSSVSATAGSTARTNILELHVGQSAIVPEFQRHPGNDTFLAPISFVETTENHKGPYQASKRVGTTAMVLVAKNCCTDKAMCTSALPW